MPTMRGPARAWASALLALCLMVVLALASGGHFGHLDDDGPEHDVACAFCLLADATPARSAAPDLPPPIAARADWLAVHRDGAEAARPAFRARGPPVHLARTI